MNRTVKINTFFGEKEVTKDDFIKQWSDTINQIYYLADDRESYDKVKTFQKLVETLSGEKFERIFKRDNE